jgi:hypothetical protein
VLLLRAVLRPPFAPARLTVIRPVPDRDVLFRVPVLRLRVPVERARVVVLRRVPVLLRVPVERARVVVLRPVVLRLRVPVARLRAVARPPLAAAARDGARRVVLRLRVPVELELELLERRRVPPVEREREVVLRERDVDARRVPVERDRLVVERRRPRPVDDATREMLSSCGCSSCWVRTGVSSWPSTGEGVSPIVCPSSKLDI